MSDVKVTVLRRRFRCICGGAFDLRGSTAEAGAALELLLKMHTGEGHGETDPKTSYRARKKAERGLRPPADGGAMEGR